MIIQLEIPKELEDDYQKDRLSTFFEKVYTSYYVGEVYAGLMGGEMYTHESEVAFLMTDAFRKSKPIC